jgi:hypothetical protein
MNVAPRQSSRSSVVLLLLALTCFSSIQAAEPTVIFGIGPINLDLERWDFATRKSEGATIDTITEKRTGKRIIFVSLNANVVTNEDPLSVIPRLIRGPNDLTITEAPKVEQGAVAGGVLSNYETMRLEKFAIVVQPKGTQATVFISTVNNPLEDPDLLEIKKLADSTSLR